MEPVALFVLIGWAIVAVLLIAFALYWNFRFVIRRGFMQAVFVGEDRRIITYMVRVDDSDKDFEILMFGKSFKYGIDKTRIYRIGRWRIPTSYYKIGDAVPRDMLDTGQDSEVAALDYAQVARNTVTRDLLAAFDTKFLSAQNIFMLTIAIVAGGLVLLGVFVNQKFGELEDQINPPVAVNSGSAPTTEDRLNNQRGSE